MAKNDHQVYREGNSEDFREAFDVNSSASFEGGEPVRLNAAGELVECTSPVDAAAEIYGISADSSLDVNGNNIAGASGQGLSGPFATVHGTGKQFKTAQFSTAGTGVLATPTQANVGDAAGFVLNGGTWFLDTGEEGVARVEKVIDVNGRDIVEAGTTGVWVIYRLVATQQRPSNLVTDPAA